MRLLAVAARELAVDVSSALTLKVLLLRRIRDASPDFFSPIGLVDSSSSRFENKRSRVDSTFKLIAVTSRRRTNAFEIIRKEEREISSSHNSCCQNPQTHNDNVDAQS